MLGSRLLGERSTGYTGYPTQNIVGMALGFSFFPPAGDFAISSNWLSSKWSLKHTESKSIVARHNYFQTHTSMSQELQTSQKHKT